MAVIRCARGRRVVLWLAAVLAGLWLGREAGVWDNVLWETSFHRFAWPLDIDVVTQVRLLRLRRAATVAPLNDWRWELLHRPACEPLTGGPAEAAKVLRVLVKSRVDGFRARQNIRDTWARQKRAGDWAVDTVFLLGTGPKDIMTEVAAEAGRCGDVVVGDFVDAYRNNTAKTLMGLRWLARSCPRPYAAALLVDDDYWVSPTRAVALFERLVGGVRERAGLGRELYAGLKFPRTEPFRLRFHKHYVPIKDYPFDAYPPYVTAGAALLSPDAAENLLHAAAFLKPYLMDDIYLGIVAKRLGIELMDAEGFHAYVSFSSWLWELFHPLDWTKAVAVHEVSTLDELWAAERRSKGAKLPF